MEDQKGTYNGNCNRTACQQPGATWYNHPTLQHYCRSCAMLINDANRRDSMRLFGHELCTEVVPAKGSEKEDGTCQYCGDLSEITPYGKVVGCCLKCLPKHYSSGCDIVQMERERLAWSLKTFPEATAISSLRKLESEIEEIEVDIVEGHRNPEEYADALMCILDSAGRQGIFIEEILHAFKVKLEINKKRVWKKNPDNSYSHVKQ